MRTRFYTDKSTVRLDVPHRLAVTTDQPTVSLETIAAKMVGDLVEVKPNFEEAKTADRQKRR